MRLWNKVFGRGGKETVYGLHSDNPVLCGGGVEGEGDFLRRLRCPADAQIRARRVGSLIRTRLDYLEQPGVEFRLRPGGRRADEMDPRELPLDAYHVRCECGQHEETLFLDMYFCGPERPIGKLGWSLEKGVSPAEKMKNKAFCPYCGHELRTPRAKQCRACLMDWHDPNNVGKLEQRIS